MNQQPDVSVIVPNYNHARFLEQRLQSIFSQTFQEIEIIILDDCSTDDSRSIIEKYRSDPKVAHIIYNEKNSGSVFYQWEKGLRLAKGKRIWIAESDDWAEEKFLEKLTDKMNADEHIGISFCNSNWVDDSGKIGDDLSVYKESFLIDGTDEIKRSLLKFNSIQNASAVLIRKDLALKHIHGLHQYRSCGDWILYLRILQESTLFYTNEKLNNFRWYHNNTSHISKKGGLFLYEGMEIFSNIDLNKLNLSKTELLSIIERWKYVYRENIKRNRPSLRFRFNYFMIMNKLKLRFHKARLSA